MPESNVTLQELSLLLAKLASTANGDGASLIGVEDAAGDYTATTLEGILAEIATLLGGASTSQYATGTYAGTQAVQPVTGVGFQPDMVLCIGNGFNGDALKMVHQPTGYFSLSTGGTNADNTVIQSLDADGFTLGSNGLVNGLGGQYAYHAWKA